MQQGKTVFAAHDSRGLGEFVFLHPPGTFALTPASLIALRAIAENQSLLRGVGLAWGSGVGCLGIAACRIPSVTRVVGLELSASNVAVARENAWRNGVAEKAEFVEADSYAPKITEGRDLLAALRGKGDFLIANPPSSDGDDGFGYRRAVLSGAHEFLRDAAVVFLSVSFQYGPGRVRDLCVRFPEFSFRCVLASTEWVPFDLRRPDLLDCLKLYAEEEHKGGMPYIFPDGRKREGAFMDARAALARFFETGENPLTKWQSLLFQFRVGAGARR